MKKNIILAIAAFMVMGLAIAAFAYTRTSVGSERAAACCCCSGDSCPMKTKDAASKSVESCCDDCDCCKEGAESCPMKKKGEASAKMMKAEHPESCPMKDKAAAMTAGMKHANAESEGKGCCCPCCNKDKEKQVAETL